MKPEWRQVVLSLCVGLAVGAAFGWWGSQYWEDRRNKDPYAWMLKRFSSKLDLTAEQKKEIGGILEANRQSIVALRTEVRPRFEKIRNSAREEIRKQLRPEQQQKFDAMQTEWEALRKKRR
jgi:hypothetical protein